MIKIAWLKNYKIWRLLPAGVLCSMLLVTARAEESSEPDNAPVPLPAPQALTAGAGDLTYGVELTWLPVPAAREYQLWRNSATGTVAAAELIATVTNSVHLDRAARPMWEYAYWVRAGDTNEAWGLFSEAAHGWRRAAVPGDYDLDELADIVLYNEAGGVWCVHLSGSGYAPLEFELGGVGNITISADYDGDGQSDPAVYQESAGSWLILYSGNDYTPHTITNFGGPGQRPLVGDFDGDGRADPALYEAASGYWRIKLAGLDNAEQVMAWGGPGWQPVPADYDGDGCTDPAVYNEMLGKWIVMFSGAGYQQVQADFGGPGWQPAPADYDGDGLADPAVYHRSMGTWKVMMSGTGYTPATTVCGGPGWQPAPADYDGDGLADPVVRNVATGQWYARLSAANYQPAASELGPAGAVWRPIASIYQAPFKFLAFGDSITYGSGSSSQGPATGYPVRVERLLNEVYGSHFVSINAGISGESSSAGRRRFAALIEQQAPRLVLLMEGTNDLGAGGDFAQLENNLRAMVQMAQARGVYIVLATIPPVISNVFNDRSAQQARIVQFNPRIYRIASDNGIPVARVYEAITAVSGWQTLLMEQESANHPNEAGYNYVRDAFYRAIADALNQGLYY